MIEEIYFPNKNIFSEISKILANCDIKETPIEAVFKKEYPFIIIVLRLVKKLGKEEISEKEFSSSIERELKVDRKTAENILKYIKEKILPSAEMVKIEKKEENIGLIPPPKKPKTNMHSGPDRYREQI